MKRALTALLGLAEDWVSPGQAHYSLSTLLFSLFSSDGACSQQYKQVQVGIVKFLLYVKTYVALSIFELLYNDICSLAIF